MKHKFAFKKENSNINLFKDVCKRRGWLLEFSDEKASYIDNPKEYQTFYIDFCGTINALNLEIFIQSRHSCNLNDLILYY